MKSGSCTSWFGQWSADPPSSRRGSPSPRLSARYVETYGQPNEGKSALCGFHGLVGRLPFGPPPVSPGDAAISLTRPGGADSLQESTLTGEGYLDDDASGGSRYHVESAASSGRHRTQAAGPRAGGFRRHGGDRHPRQLRGRACATTTVSRSGRCKVHEPYQMLGLIDEDLKQALGIDVEGVFRRAAPCSASRTRTGSRGRCSTALRCWCPAAFNTDAGAERRHPHVSRGRPVGPAQRPDAQGRLLLRHHHPPGADRRREARTSRTTWRSSARSPTPTWSTSRARPTRLPRATGRAVLANFGGTAFGDIALVPAPLLKHPKGIRDVAEWYMSAPSRRRDYVHEVFEPAVRDRPGQPGEDPRRGRRPGRRPCSSRGTDFGTQTSAVHRSVPTYRELCSSRSTGGSTTGSTRTRRWKTFIHSCGSVVALLPDIHRGRLRHPQPGAVLGGGHGPGAR